MPSSLKEVLQNDIQFVAEYNGAYYFKPKTDDRFDHCMWKVDKKSGEVSYFDEIEFMEFDSEATLIDPEKLRSVS